MHIKCILYVRVCVYSIDNWKMFISNVNRSICRTNQHLKFIYISVVYQQKYDQSKFSQAYQIQYIFNSMLSNIPNMQCYSSYRKQLYIIFMLTPSMLKRCCCMCVSFIYLASYVDHFTRNDFNIYNGQSTAQTFLGASINTGKDYFPGLDFFVS